MIGNAASEAHQHDVEKEVAKSVDINSESWYDNKVAFER
jgi:hypothetical protein